jgi:hypothetical protein
LNTGVGSSLIRMKKLLMVCYGGGHVKIIAPLYQSLKDSYDITILALTVAGNYLDKLDIPFVRMSDFDDLLTCEVLNLGKQFVGKSTDSSIVPLKETVAYHGLSFLDLIDTEGSETLAHKKYEKIGRASFLPVNTMSKILQIIQPDLVLATNSPRAERAAFIAANNAGIPSICINDNVWIEGGARQIAELGCVDLLCVLSQEVKNELVEKTNFDESNIIVTGTPVFDKLKSLKKSIKIANTQKVILLADCDLPKTSPLYQGITADPLLGGRIRSELNRLAEKNHWKIIFRPHPTQQYNYSPYPNITESNKNEDLHELLATVDVVITAISTVGLEGKVIGKGLVSIEGSVYRKAGSYSQLGFSTGIFEQKDLEDAIIKEFNSACNMNNELYEGCSIRNITNCIRGLLK